MASDGCKHNIAVRANMWQQRADKQFEKPPVLAFSGQHYQHLGHHEVLPLDNTSNDTDNNRGQLSLPAHFSASAALQCHFTA